MAWAIEVGSCLRRNDGGGRRNDGEGRRNDGGGAGTTGKAIGVREGGRRWLASSHPPPNLPPERGGRDELGKGVRGLALGAVGLGEL